MEQQEILDTMILTRLNRFNLSELLMLYRKMGSATEIMLHRNNIREVLPDCSKRLSDSLKDISEASRRADVELEYDIKNGIQPLCMNDAKYPQRLKECDDAPIMLYYKGSADLNKLRVISVVGTRHCTAYGQDLIRSFTSELRRYCDNVLVVSGLAYGVDISAHRNALQNGYDTVAVLAHGLDDLYPQRHRDTADKMLRQGGLLTEFMTMTNADKMNFVRRNRIVAGMADACLLVESAAHGGGLITAGIARSYNRDVFTFPGRVGDAYSEGCNNLIRDNGAALVTSAKDFVHAMGWEQDARLAKAHESGIERQLFPDLNADEQLVVDILNKKNDLQINMIAVQTSVPISKLTAVLFELEMKGVVKTLAGGVFHLIRN